MGRPSKFSVGEDRIIVRYANEPAPVVNAALIHAGFPARTAAQITARRHYLTTTSKDPAAQKRGQLDRLIRARSLIESELVRLTNRERKLRADHQKLEEHISALTGSDRSRNGV